MATHTHQAGLLTALFLETLRLNARLLAAGDALVADLGLTSARWQVLAAIAMAPARRTVADLARDMGLSRQAVLRVITDLGRAGLVRPERNPRHRRAHFAVLTAEGKRIYAAAMARRAPWANALAHDLPTGALESALDILGRVRGRLEGRP